MKIVYIENIQNETLIVSYYEGIQFLKKFY